VRNIAVQALWPFYRQVVFKRDSFDLDLRPVATIKLPKDGWRFHLDPQRNGHLQDWYEPSFDDSGWDEISIEKVWRDAGYQYTGVTWYRRVVALPEKMDHLAVEMHFGGVDESAWVWVNGVYVGQYDIGPDGWNIPFVLDITDEVRWGMGNAVVVRAMNTRFAGGIWKPVRIEVLK
jgi:beta-galactosidase/beta-glucuronidase